MGLKRIIDMYKDDGYVNDRVKIIQPVACIKPVENSDDEGVGLR